jgi:transcriptional regulator with PAS, ATPase and Fis domain
MNWDRDRFKKILGTKGLSEALKQNPKFIQFREANIENLRAEAEAKLQEHPGFPPCHYEPEWLVEQAFLHTPEGLGEAEKISLILRQGGRGRDPGNSSSSKSYRYAARTAKVQNLDWELVGGSEHIAKLRQEIIFVAQKMKKYDFSVLIEGPSGTGKELIAKGISKETGRNNFLAINCAALPGSLFESELFGYKKGAFTGANQDKPGLIKKAEGGILFLDEIGDLTQEHQGKILRLLQEKTYIPIGALKEEKVNNLRIIVATNKNLGVEIKAGRFREDLYYRLNHRVIQTIPLEDRRVDIICLLHHYRNERDLKIDSRAKALLYCYDFPGNVRELESLLYSADDYQYIRDTLAERVANSIGKDAKALLEKMTKIYIEGMNYLDSMPNLDEKAQKTNKLIDVSHFFDAIEIFDRDDRVWERETQRYEILTLLGKTEYAKDDICRILGIRTNFLSPKTFKQQFGLDLPSREQLNADIEALGFKLYPDYIYKFPWPPLTVDSPL